ncbi:MAG: long-chain fatty acid--CoA ligase [Burkholderiaceae bacterium]|nr:long-chain fatty acid--CoA ligase [Burkholderiaceae bacterium]
MYLTQCVHKGVRQCPQAVAVVGQGLRWTFAQFQDRVARLAGALQGLGMQAGDRVGMLAQNGVRSVEFFQGTWWGGGVVNPVNTRWSAREIAYSLDDCDTRILLVDAHFAALAATLPGLSASLQTLVYCGEGPAPTGMLSYEALLAAAPAVPDALRQGDDLAAVMYTGGTTGQPKGVMLSQANFYTGTLSGIAASPRRPGGVGLVVSPLFHVAGCALSLQLMRRLFPQVILPAFEEVQVLQTLQDEGVTELFLVPTMVKRLIEHPRFADFDRSSLRNISYGAAPIDATLLSQAMAAFPGVQFSQSYGMTELSPTVSTVGPDEHLPGPDQARWLRSAGRAVPIAELRIVDPEDRELPTGQIGEICARGPMVMQGYWNKPAETAEALRGGWLHTGDSGYLDEEGYLYVVDRIKDMIVSGGENVYSAEVENVLARLPQVSMCAVIGVPDARWGERVHAVIVLRPGAVLDEAHIAAHCRAFIAGYKCPRSVEFRTELPLSAAGKLLKFNLREPYWAGHSRRVG